ncbi:MAG: hypothetical protein BMS9Abin11_1397 [Gammaproteobacteria bacterium]|nr:MAG: hypothetical protein BMS9Abin11_1397 [Gammaproteobacteria bacterium]
MQSGIELVPDFVLLHPGYTCCKTGCGWGLRQKFLSFSPLRFLEKTMTKLLKTILAVLVLLIIVPAAFETTK